MGDIGLILSQTFATISDPMAILMVFAGTFMGLTFGALPGLTATMGVALLVPITDSMDPAIAIGMMLGLVLGQKFEWELPTTPRQFGGLGILLKRPIALDFVAVACVTIAKFVYTGSGTCCGTPKSRRNWASRSWGTTCSPPTRNGCGTVSPRAPPTRCC